GRSEGRVCADGWDIRGRAGGEKQGGGAMPGLGMSGFGAGRDFVKSRFSADVNVSNVHKTATNALSD
ncbi:MAG TPA: hypothetical protein DD982_21585, partial [Thalassospira sp.]|nr:hypothetical protein [Thalassospira sp.]